MNPMTDAVITPPSAPETPVAHPRELLRHALGDLGKLSIELTLAEKQLDARRAADLDATAKSSEKLEWDAQERHRKSTLAAAAESDKRTAAARADRALAEKLAKTARGDAADAAKTAHDEQSSQIKKTIRDREWEADALLEGAETAANQRTKEARQQQETMLAELADREGKLIASLDLFGQAHLMLATAPATVPVGDELDERHARERYEAALLAEQAQREALAALPAAKAFVGARPYLVALVLLGLGAGGGYLLTPGGGIDPMHLGIGAGAGFLVAAAIGIALKVSANRKIRALFVPLRQELENAKAFAAAVNDRAVERIKSEYSAAKLKRDEEIRSVRDRHVPIKAKAEAAYKAATEASDAAFQSAVAAAAAAESKALAEVADLLRRRNDDAAARFAKDLAEARAETAARLAAAEKTFADGHAGLQARWVDGLRRIATATHIGQSVSGTGSATWESMDWKRWTGATQFPPAVRFGELDIDAIELAKPVAPEAATVTPADSTAAPATDPATEAPTPEWRFGDVLPARFTVPAMLAYGEGALPQAGSLMINFERDGRSPALSMLRAAMARLLASMPPGRVRLTMIDPVGLGQTFAGFMHLADYDEQLTGPRIWTDQEQIDKRMADLTDHMETVIQKYLRNEFETIDAYNAQAGELAEPYRFLVVADFPNSFTAESLKKLTSILHSGAKCGVHVLLARDSRIQMERRVLEDIRGGTTVIETGPLTKGAPPPKHPVWVDDVFGRFPLTPDPEPSDAALTELCKAVGEGARRANRVEVDVKALLPKPEQRWGASSASEFTIPVGRSGATRLQSLKLGKGVSQHGLLAGKTGSGKSTLLHVLVTNASQWYTPDEVEFYLIDFKKGVEFKAYSDNHLPHVKAVAIESDREFGLSILQRLDAELSRRGELYRKAAVQDLASYRETRPGEVMPRILLVVDEFQEFFSEDDKLGQEAASLIDRIVRQGRAFGMHVLLGSQTIGGASGLGRATLGQMAVRVALQCSEADSTMILGESNTAARLLTRPGEAIYNDNGGLPEANSPFQVAWLPDDKRDALLQDVVIEGKKRGWVYNAVVFEGNKPADLTANRELPALNPAVLATANLALLGEPVAIKPTTKAPFRRQPGANMLLIGQQEEAAMATMQASLLSLAKSSRDAKFVVFEGTMQDSHLRNALTLLAPKIQMQAVDYREAEAAIAALHADLQKRLEAPDEPHPSTYLAIYALQRYRALRKTGDDFGFSMSDEPKKVSADKMLAEIVKEGPTVGIHTLAWADTLVSVERVFDRAMMREFDYRVLFQMSASDSSALIDSPAANRLGPVRALLFSEEQGLMEKFRPFALVDAPTLAKLA